MEVLTRLDLDLEYSSEKLVNLENLLMHVLILGNDFEGVVDYDNISVDFLEKAMEFDLLHAILNSEVRELDNFMGTLQPLTVDTHQKISAGGELKELYSVVESKLHDTEESLRKSQDHMLEIKMQLAKLQMTSLVFNQNEWGYNMDADLWQKIQVSGLYLKRELQSVEHRNILRMLEKSLTKELDLDKKLTKMKQNEEDLKLKLRLTEQIALCIEEAAEVIWGRFLEAENSAEVLMGISKEMVGRLQVVQLTLDSSIHREQEMNFKLQEYVAQLNAKDEAMEKLNRRSSQLVADNAETASLREKVKLLEEQFRESMFQLKEANESNETSQEQLAEMESVVESMKETIYDAENRAENAETKINQLTESNLELTEELNFLKGSNDSNTKKLSLLEKQLRDLELQLQHAKTSSEASQEQQNMLYAAIWDMETLIDELKQKVSKAESKTEKAEEQCLILSEANLDLKNEVKFLRSRRDSLETSLDQDTVEKLAGAKDINMKTNVIMNMVMQLAMERERIQQKFYALANENKLLKERSLKANKDAPSVIPEDRHGNNEEEFPLSRLNSTTNSSKATSNEKAAELLSKSFQVEESPDNASAAQTEMQSSISAEPSSDSDLKLETMNLVETRQISRMHIYMALFFLLLSVLAAYLLNRKHAIFKIFDG